MIHANEIKKYQEECPKQEDVEWEITRSKLKNIASYELPSNWLERIIIDIERSVIAQARDYKNKINGIPFYPFIGFESLHCGYQHVYLKQKEMEILSKELEKYGYTLVLGNEWMSDKYSNIRIEWK